MLVIRFHIGIMYRVDQNHIYTEYIRYFGLEITKYTVYIYVYIRFWPTLIMYHVLALLRILLKSV
jgi:hypothetical protein